MPLGQILAIDEKFDNYGIFHIDAHADLRENYQGFEDSHASIFYNLIKQTKSLDKLVQVGVRDFCEEELSLINNNKKLIKTYFDSDLRKPRLNGKILKKIKKIISKLPKHVYVSVDIDGLNPTLCPNTGTPVPGGLSFDEFCEFIKEIRESGRKIIGLDLCEVTPIGENSWDAIVGARVLFKLLGFALCQKNT